jgi:hypothetical protein
VRLVDPVFCGSIKVRICYLRMLRCWVSQVNNAPVKNVNEDMIWRRPVEESSLVFVSECFLQMSCTGCLFWLHCTTALPTTNGFNCVVQVVR